jgi:hypothetical protein
MINQATFNFYQVLLDESGSQMQLLASVGQYCFEAASADRRHTWYKNIGLPPRVDIHRISKPEIEWIYNIQKP